MRNPLSLLKRRRKLNKNGKLSQLMMTPNQLLNRTEEVSEEDGVDEVMEVEIGPLKSINSRLAKLNVLEVMVKDMNQLKASLEYSLTN